MLIIGIGNKARQGKDMAAEAALRFYLSRNDTILEGGVYRSLNVQIFKFATALYQEVNAWLKPFNGVSNWANATIIETRPLTNGYLGAQATAQYYTALPKWVQPDPDPEVSELAPYGKHPKLLQWWGTDYRRAQDPGYWTKKLFANIPSDTDIALITDVRFPNEFMGVKERHGYTVNVTRLNEDRSIYCAPDRPSDHVSETALDTATWDFKLINQEGHQALLKKQAVCLVEYLRGLK